MSTSNTPTVEYEDEPDSTPSRAIEFTTQRAKDGTLPLLAGVTLFVRSIQTRDNRKRAVVQGIAASALVGIGLRQRRSEKQPLPPEDHTGTSEQRAESHQPGTNPRGTSGEPDVEQKTESDEGSIQFTDDQTDEMEQDPNFDEDKPEDPRLNEGEEATEIDLSEASMADEASEAAGPSSGQSQPTQIDDTEPETDAEEADSLLESEDSETDEDERDDEKSR